MSSRLFVLAALAAALLAGGATAASDRAPSASRERVEAIVVLQGAPLAYATGRRAEAMRAIDRRQGAFRRALREELPDATVRWRYRIVQNGLAVALPRSEVGALRRLPGVVRVVASSVRYRPLVGPAGGTIRARSLPGIPAGAAGEGLKIGIIDDGVDQTHPFFDPTGYVMPPGYPKGNTAFTTAKVIVARAFAPVGTTYRGARLPFDSAQSHHGTHVAGIAAGNAATSANGARISGVAPRAYIGNYKALGIPTDGGVGLDGNAPEIVAAIEAAVADGMDVINLSLGEPEIEPAQDVVAKALDAAAAAGVVPVVAAGNDFEEFGPGSLASPGTAADAITVASVSDSEPPRLAASSSGGPTALSLRLKPDVAAPGVNILSSVPGGWELMSGTSMATPHVSGAAALLLQLHPDWSPADVKAALMETARSVRDEGAPATPARAGAGLVDVAAAAHPLVLARPASLSFGLLADGQSVSASIALADAGGGAGTWSATVETIGSAGATVTVPTSVEVPGTLTLGVAVATDAADADLTGTIALRREGAVRRIPFWGRLATPALVASAATPLPRPGSYTGSTLGRPARATVYRYPDVPPGGPVTARLGGPERLYRVTIRRAVANFGVVITSRARGVRVEPRVVAGTDENRLTGYAALPFNLNPYLASFAAPVLAAGAIAPARGAYTVVFDSATPAQAGTFTFRFWIDDTTPPRATLLTRAVRRGTALRVRVTDAGSGVDPQSLDARIDGRPVSTRLAAGVLRIATGSVQRGAHTLRLQVSDYQETRNMENVGPILPNTRVLRTRVTIR